MTNIVNIGPKGSKLDWDNWGKPITDAVNQLWLLANPPTFRIYQTTPAQSLANGAFVPINFNNEEFDTDNGHDNTTNPSRYTVVTAGVWEFGGKMSFDVAAAGGRRIAQWQKNGVVIPGSEHSMPPAVTASLLPVEPVFVRMAVGDYIQLVIAQDSGSTLNTFVGTAAAGSFMQGRLIAL